MPTWKVLLLMAAWVLASVMIALVSAIVGTEVLTWLGLVESDTTSYSVALNGIFLVVLVALVAVPFFFRNRFAVREPYDP
jgi:E3 ubiquitin-protein ligase DOA10